MYRMSLIGRPFRYCSGLQRLRGCQEPHPNCIHHATVDVNVTSACECCHCTPGCYGSFTFRRRSQRVLRRYRLARDFVILPSTCIPASLRMPERQGLCSAGLNSTLLDAGSSVCEASSLVNKPSVVDYSDLASILMDGFNARQVCDARGACTVKALFASCHPFFILFSAFATCFCSRSTVRPNVVLRSTQCLLRPGLFPIL